ncbi:MAG: class I SAM-dependent methyltransferase [Dehalococcoidia bacterium]
MSIRRFVPWWALLAVRIALSFVPVSQAFWKRVGVFRSGGAAPGYFIDVARAHLDTIDVRGKAVVELGPGDSLVGAITARALGAAEVWAIDVAPRATRSAQHYAEARRALTETGLPATGDGFPGERDGIHYRIDGLAGLRALPTGSVDIVWSNAVLEHVRREEMAPLIAEIARVLRPGGVSVHQVDLRDHLVGGANQLRVPSRWWESGLVARSGVYTNQMLLHEIVALFEAAGLTTESLTTTEWDDAHRPDPARLAAPWCDAAPHDLRAADFCLRSRRPAEVVA